MVIHSDAHRSLFFNRYLNDMNDWHLWLIKQHVFQHQIYQDSEGLYWFLNKKKKRINWFEKYQPHHKCGMKKKHHKLLQALHGRTNGSLVVLDACAGLGHDLFVMALGDCKIIACEKNPQIFAVLSDMMARAQQQEWFGKKNISLVFGRAEEVMLGWPSCRVRPDVVYLDPMFEKNFKGEVKANAALLKSIVNIEQAHGLFKLALNFARLKVVVKRPCQADHLCSIKPTYMINGKTTRYDVYQTG